jgi:hypothetical protein
MRILFLALALTFLCQAAPAQQQMAEPKLASLEFLLGKWVGEGSSKVGAGSGYFTFESSLQGKVMVRKNHAEYPATRDRPTYNHDDLMIVYVDAATKQLHAFYTDSEEHVINYTISISGDRKSVAFLSDVQTAAPRYRLTYAVTQPDKMSVTLELAQPDKPDQFQKIVEGKVRKIGLR